MKTSIIFIILILFCSTAYTQISGQLYSLPDLSLKKNYSPADTEDSTGTYGVLGIGFYKEIFSTDSYAEDEKTINLNLSFNTFIKLSPDFRLMMGLDISKFHQKYVIVHISLITHALLVNVKGYKSFIGFGVDGGVCGAKGSGGFPVGFVFSLREDKDFNSKLGISMNLRFVQFFVPSFSATGMIFNIGIILK